MDKYLQSSMIAANELTVSRFYHSSFFLGYHIYNFNNKFKTERNNQKLWRPRKLT